MKLLKKLKSVQKRTNPVARSIHLSANTLCLTSSLDSCQWSNSCQNPNTLPHKRNRLYNTDPCRSTACTRRAPQSLLVRRRKSASRRAPQTRIWGKWVGRGIGESFAWRPTAFACRMNTCPTWSHEWRGPVRYKTHGKLSEEKHTKNCTNKQDVIFTLESTKWSFIYWGIY